MYLQQIVSYAGAWKTLVERYPKELQDIQAVVAGMTPEAIAAAHPLRDEPYFNKAGVTRYRLDGYWVTAMRKLGWQEISAPVRALGRRSIYMRPLGHLKNGVSVAFIRHRESLNRWLYTLAPLAVRNGLVELPIALSLLTTCEEKLLGGRIFSGAMPERMKEELLALSPLSHANPFLLLGVSADRRVREITELQSDEDGGPRHVIINRSIEFPPEYHQAGLGILSYFGTVLREKYPSHNATVRIEQEGLRVRLVIESDNGDREVIEKALQEYELVVRGETSPESFFESKSKVLELKNELRIAQVRIESQKDLLAYQGEEIASLRNLIGHSLTTVKFQPISVTVNPEINVNTSAALQVQDDASQISEYVQALSRLAANDPEIELRLLDLEESIASLSARATPAAVKGSSGMRKLKGWLDEASNAGSSANKFLENVSDGIELVQKLARRYNSIAEWCGAPQVPSILVGEKSGP